MFSALALILAVTMISGSCLSVPVEAFDVCSNLRLIGTDCVFAEDIDDDSDDDVNVVIGEIAAPTSYSGFKIGKAGGGTFSTPQTVDKKVGWSVTDRCWLDIDRTGI